MSLLTQDDIEATGLPEGLVIACFRNRQVEGQSEEKAVEYVRQESFLRRMREFRQVFVDGSFPALDALDRGDMEAFDRLAGEAGKSLYDKDAPAAAVVIWRAAACIAELARCKELRAERYLFICARLSTAVTPLAVEIWKESWEAIYSTRIWYEDSPWRPRARDFAVQTLAPGLERLLAGPLPEDLQANQIAACLRAAAEYIGDPPAMDLCRLALRAFDAEAELHDTPEEKEGQWSHIQRERAWLLDRMYDLSGDVSWLEKALKAMEAWFAATPKTGGADYDRMEAMTVGPLFHKLQDVRFARPPRK